jgi:hypothetical protein
MIHIWHYTGNCQPRTVTEARAKFSMYQHVASIAVDCLDTAYRFSQHIDHDWTKHNSVTSIVDQCRSTMVGDIFMFRGTMYMVDRIGFTEMPAQPNSV